MAGPGVALRLHEFRECLDSREAEGAKTWRQRTSRPGRDAQGLYPGQLGRVHTVHPKDCGARPPQRRHQHENYPQSFDVQTLRALAALHRGPAAVLGQHRPQTAYQDRSGGGTDVQNI